MKDPHDPLRQQEGERACPTRVELLLAHADDSHVPNAERVRNHAAVCSRCSQILQSDGRRQEAFLADHSFEQALPHILARAGGWQRRRRLALGLVPVATAASLVVVLLLARLPSGPGLRTKGEVSLGFYLQQGMNAVAGESGAVLHENDRIQFTYSSGSHRYLFLVSLEDQGRVSNFNYQGAPVSVPITPGNHQILEGSIILDDSLGPERVYAIFSDQPLRLEMIREAANSAYHQLRSQGLSVKELDRLPLPYPQASILLIKK